MSRHNFHCSSRILFNKCRDIASDCRDKVHLCCLGILQFMLRHGFCCCDKLLLDGLSLCRDILRFCHNILHFLFQELFSNYVATLFIFVVTCFLLAGLSFMSRHTKIMSRHFCKISSKDSSLIFRLRQIYFWYLFSLICCFFLLFSFFSLNCCKTQI